MCDYSPWIPRILVTSDHDASTEPGMCQASAMTQDVSAAAREVEFAGVCKPYASTEGVRASCLMFTRQTSGCDWVFHA